MSEHAVTKGIELGAESVIGKLFGTDILVDNSSPAVAKGAGAIAQGIAAAQAGRAMRGHKFDAMTQAWKQESLEDTAEMGA